MQVGYYLKFRERKDIDGSPRGAFSGPTWVGNKSGKLLVEAVATDLLSGGTWDYASSLLSSQHVNHSLDLRSTS